MMAKGKVYGYFFLGFGGEIWRWRYTERFLVLLFPCKIYQFCIIISEGFGRCLLLAR